MKYAGILDPLLSGSKTRGLCALCALCTLVYSRWRDELLLERVGRRDFALGKQSPAALRLLWSLRIAPCRLKCGQFGLRVGKQDDWALSRMIPNVYV